jgi:Fic family protein
MNDPTQAVNELPALVLRVRAEFSEMPGMCLTVAQAARLWQVSTDHAERLLSELVQTGFLVRRDGERYRRPSLV